MFVHKMPEFIPEIVGIGAQYKVTINERSGALTPLFAKERTGSGVAAQKADRWILATLIALYGQQSSPRGNLDAGRLNRLFGREIIPASPEVFDPASCDTDLRIAFPNAFTYVATIE
ncbi:hypothetical protein [Bradyrhizobium sp. ARR65]|uniref:hypothetical protein n=1 Tax=Bradyrhizobium sp. ARR65 TaxID=1040989 RepID=UPI00046687D5|nr:hypothetical protein [Bradyrhizobium sp. ARR65]